MPLNLPTINAVNTLFFVRAESSWMEQLGEALSALTPVKQHQDKQDKEAQQAIVQRHLELIERRRDGELDWQAVLETERPAQKSRLYSAMLKEEAQLPLYSYGPLALTVDLFNPNNEGNDPAYDPNFEIIELLIHRDVINPWSTGCFPDGTKINPGSVEDYRRLTRYGTALGDLVEMWAEILQPVFAFSEGLQYHARWMDRVLSSSSVKNVAPAGIKYWDYLWPLAYWSKSLLDDSLSERLKNLQLNEKQMQAIDKFERVGVQPEPVCKELSTGGLLVQYRFIFGAEGRTSRARVETPLAKQAGLRTINLVYRR